MQHQRSAVADGVKLPPVGDAALDAVLTASVAAQDVPGVVAMIADRDGTVYQGTFGTGDIASGRPMRDDDLFFIASMTKAITSVAAMQLVERGLLHLDAPIADILPELRSPQVLDGFEANCEPVLRPARRSITLRHLLSHTAGFAYIHWHAGSKRYAEVQDIPDVLSYRLRALDMPLVSDPGEQWHYGISLDFVGRAIERVSGLALDDYFARHILGPLGMRDTVYSIPEPETARLGKVHSRQPDGTYTAISLEMPVDPEFHPGGVGLFCTAADYIIFLRMILNGGRLNGVRILDEATVTTMSTNQLGGVVIEPMRSEIPFWSADVDLFPGMEKHWGLGFLINPQPSPTGRNAGSLTWAGACNSFFWIDPTAGIAGVFMAQLVPFCDARALNAFTAFETAVYAELQTPVSV